MKRVIVKIDQLGTPTIEAQGFTGMGCQGATAGIESALGGTGQRTMKPEAYNSDEQQDEIKQQW